jgi:D-alanine-D-alanine ligase
MLINVLLLYGGKSGEHEVSLNSAASVLKNLNPSLYTITPVGIDKQGQFFQNDYQELVATEGPLPVCTASSKLIPCLFENGKLSIPADIVFPVIHGPLYEDGCLQGLLELAGVPYVGCDVLSSAIGMDKDIARRLVSALDIKFARYRTLSWHASAEVVEQVSSEVIKNFGFPLFVKPCSMGSSVGIHKANTKDDLLTAIADAKRYDKEILIEEFIQGREIELSVLENKNPSLPPLVSIPGEILVRHPDGFYSYSAKYLDSEQTDLLIPAKLSEQLIVRLKQAAADIFTQLKCKGMARVDFFVNDKTEVIYFNEVNTLPGFTAISMYPKLWDASGLGYGRLLDNLIEIAQIHANCRKKLVTHYL